MFNFKEPFLYFVTPKIDDNIEKWEKTIKEAVLGGVKMVQIRDKNAPAKEIILAAKRLHPFLKKFNVPLLINDRVDIAHAIACDGVHLGQSDLEVSQARAILGRKAIIGLSVETMEQALKAKTEKIDYLAASPVFSTSSKLDCSSPWGLEGLKRLCYSSEHPIVAIGGITLDNLADLLKCGAKGLAVITAISNDPNPQDAAKRLTNKMNRDAEIF